MKSAVTLLSFRSRRLRPHALLTSLSCAALAAASGGAAPAPLQKEEIIELESFVVRAFSDERDRSVEAKRGADSIADFISADRLGQFVDDNIGSVVERIPGVYTSGAGQSGGSGVSVRGLGGGFNSLQLDGDRLPSNQGGTRGLSIDNIPAELIGAVAIFKAPTPERDADSIGGVVNVETKSGLDLKRRLVGARAVTGWDSYGSGYQHRGSFTYSDRLSDRLGVFLSLSRSENERQRDQVDIDPANFYFDQLVSRDRALPRIVDAPDNRVFMPSRIDYRRTVQAQQNTGANLNLDWQATPDWRLSLRTFFARFDEQRPQLRNLWRFDRSVANDPVNRSFPHAEYVYLDESDGTFYFGNEQRIARRIADQDETEKLRRVQIEGRHRWTGAALDYSASFGRSDRKMANDTYIFTADDIQLRARVGNLLHPDFGLIRPGDFFHNAAANPRVPAFDDPVAYGSSATGAFNITERRVELIDASDSIDAFQLSYRKHLDSDTVFKIGAKHREQRKDNARDYTISPGFAFVPANATFERFDGFFNGWQDLGLYPTYDSLRRQNPLSPRDLMASVLGGANAPADTRRDSTILDLGAKEKVSALYGQLSRTWGAFTLLGGVRWERTQSDYRGFTADVTGNPAIDAPRAVKGGNTYDGLYPSLHAQYRLGERAVLRAAVGRTLARPEFEDLTPSSYATMSTEAGTGNAIVNLQRGNSGLKPTQSSNLDLSCEYYFAGGGAVSLAGFYKEMRDWIYTSTTVAPGSQFPEYASIPNLSAVRVASSFNGDLAKVYGVEFSFQKPLLAGFSLGLNGTLLAFDVNRAQTGLDRVPGQSDRLLRLSLDYESKRFIARLSLRDSGCILDTQMAYTAPAAIAYFQKLGMGQLTRAADGSQTINLGLYDDSGLALEATAEVRLNRWARLFVQGSNLLGEDSRTLLEKSERFPASYEYRAWSALAGVKLSF